jgi:hypothetical protein
MVAALKAQGVEDPKTIRQVLKKLQRGRNIEDGTISIGGKKNKQTFTLPDSFANPDPGGPPLTGKQIRKNLEAEYGSRSDKNKAFSASGKEFKGQEAYYVKPGTQTADAAFAGKTAAQKDRDAQLQGQAGQDSSAQLAATGASPAGSGPPVIPSDVTSVAGSGVIGGKSPADILNDPTLADRTDQGLPSEVGGGDIADTGDIGGAGSQVGTIMRPQSPDGTQVAAAVTPGSEEGVLRATDDAALAKMKNDAGITGAGVADAEKTIGAPIGSGGITAADNAGTPQDAGDAGEAGVLAKQQADATAAANVDDFSGIKKAQMKTSTRNAQAQAADATAAANVDDFSGMATADAARKDRDAAANVDDFSGMGKAADQVAAANVDDFSGMAGAERQTAARAMGDVEGGVTTALAKPKASNLPNTPPPGTGTQVVAKQKASNLPNTPPPGTGGIAAGIGASKARPVDPNAMKNKAAFMTAQNKKPAPTTLANKAITPAPKQTGRENSGMSTTGTPKRGNDMPQQSTILKGTPGTTPDRGDMNPADRPKVDPAIAAKKAADMKARLAAQEKREMNANR